MFFAVIMQHANMAYHVQRAYKGPTIWLLSGGGGGGVVGIGDLGKKYPEVWFWAQKSLARKYLPYNSFVCQGKTFYYQRFGGKKFLCKLMKSPIPWSKSNGRPVVTCRKSCYCLILRLRHQSLIVRSRSMLVHVYSLLHDECNTAGSRRGSIPVSTVLRKSVRFFIINIFLVKNFKLSKLISGKWFGQSVNIPSEWLRNPGKGTLLPGEHAPRHL